MLPEPIALVAGANQSIKLFRGESKTITVDMTGYDLAGASIEWIVANSPFADSTIIAKDDTAGISVDTNTLTITLDTADTENLEDDVYYPDVYYHELRLLSGGKVTVAMTGNFLLLKSYTEAMP